ncbi:unnamed protein product [Tilletia laevis]|uniref:Mitochondrial import inner membrane translocase subunit TIM50 n=2 Tax=Tilletia TaxID=13289 RepID=A0A8T8T4K7_9BASI|nr:hypothetical protein CF336_g8714 [Tilletia laevis]KAE8256260.1 hypothetical protein A4X03_0g5444 [Tilletia caries]CAD6884518.1 unnamed protein product [Tilletia caries]CAD6903931.1 unnamed protein product [Tilletia caries]CAD6949642.1 unnamed protein product [Tilletia laevis]
MRTSISRTVASGARGLPLSAVATASSSPRALLVARRAASAASRHPPPQATRLASSSSSSSAPKSETAESGSKAQPAAEADADAAEQDDAPLRPHSFNLDTTAAPLLRLGAGKGKHGKPGAEGADRANGGEDGAPKRPTAEQTGRGVLKFVWPALVGLAGYGAYQFGLPLDDEEAIRHKDNPLADSWLGRIRLRTFSIQSELSSPVSDMLLPPQDPRIQRPYTLVVELDDLLVHSDWDRQRGWRIAKRPGLDYFLGYLSTFFEIIVFTSSPQFGSEPIVQKLDQDGRYIFQRLYKEHCRFVEGELVKDLSYLNRDLSKTIILDTDKSRFRFQPENGFVVKPWNGDPADRELFRWIQLLESVFIWNFPDVRQFVKTYDGVEDVPAAHKAQLQAHRQSELGQLEAAAKQRRRFGLGGASITGQGPRAREPKTYYDAQSELFHKMYIEDEAHWQQNKDGWRKQNEELDAKRWEKFVAENGQPTMIE